MYFLLSYRIHFPYPAQTEISRCDTESTVQLSALGFFQFQLLKASQAYSGCNYWKKEKQNSVTQELAPLSFLTIIHDPSHLSHASVLAGVFKIYLPSGIAFQHSTSTKHFSGQCYGVPPPMALIITAFPWLLAHKTILERTIDGFVQALNQPAEQNAMFHLH